MSESSVTERSFYPVLLEVINEVGGKAVSEVRYESVPDLVIAFGGRDWILSVKIGESMAGIKSAMLQYLRHKEESKIPFGMLLMLPENARRVPPKQDSLSDFIRTSAVTVLLDAGEVKRELAHLTFPQVMRYVSDSILPAVAREEKSYFSLQFVVGLLQQHVQEMMDEIELDQDQILRIVINKKLLMNIGHMAPEQAEAVGKFLSSYILLSQILFLRLFYTAHSHLFSGQLTPATITKSGLKRAFATIEEINYKPIYAVDVLDIASNRYVVDTFRLIWGLEIERAKHELPGRIFHELMPSHIRKMMAAFYTRPIAADLLAAIAIRSSGETILDPASGSGTILVSAYKRKAALWQSEGRVGNPHKRFCEDDIFGADIMPFSVHLTEANLAALDIGTTIDRTQIIQGDSLKIVRGKVYPGGVLQTDLFPSSYQPGLQATLRSGEKYDVKLDRLDTVLMNPPFTKVERGIRSYVDMARFENRCGGEVGLWGHFLSLADELLKKGGTLGAVIPINILRGRESQHVRELIFRDWTPLFVVKPTRNYAFSEWAEYRDILVVARREKARKSHKVKFCVVKKDLAQLNSHDIQSISSGLQSKRKLRTPLADIDSHALGDVHARFDNLMWFCGLTDFGYRDQVVAFLSRIPKGLSVFPEGYFREGFRSFPKGASDFLFATRHSHDSRVRESFLRFQEEGPRTIRCTGPLGGNFNIDRGDLVLCPMFSLH